MRTCILNFLFFLLLSGNTFAQTLEKKVSQKACLCLGEMEISDYQPQEKINECIFRSMSVLLLEGSPDEREVLGNTEGINKTFPKVYEILEATCPSAKRLLLEQLRIQFYSLSDSWAANRHLKEGDNFFKADQLEKAISAYKKAVAKDPEFILALDNLAIANKRLGLLGNTIHYYKKSLEVFPEGDVALLNIASAYTLTREFPLAEENYLRFTKVYPEDPEGYFGLAKIYTLSGRYEQGLDNAFRAHRIYILTESSFALDSERLIGELYNHLKEENKLTLFYQKAKEYGMELE